MAIIKPIGTIDRSFDKLRIVEMAEADAQEVIQSGKYDLLKVYVEMKRYEMYLKTIIEELKDGALQKALETDENKVAVDNANVSITRRRVFHFEADGKWQSLHNDLEMLRKFQKDREALLKDIPPGEKLILTDPETGEVEELTAPPSEVVVGLMVKL